MRYVFRMIALTCTTFSCFASEHKIEVSVFEKSPVEVIDHFNTSSNYITSNYRKVGSTLSYQYAGFGVRHRDILSKKGSDVSVNLSVAPIMLIRNAGMVMPTIKYTKLSYKVPERSSRYTGFGGEIGGAVVLYSHGYFTAPYFNGEIVFGKENEKGGFSQVGINLVPLAGTVLGIVDASSSHPYGDLGKYVAMVSSTMVLSYTVGF